MPMTDAAAKKPALLELARRHQMDTLDGYSRKYFHFGSDPGQKHAFDDAMAQVGCPDQRPARDHLAGRINASTRKTGLIISRPAERLG
jgi:hypothetical protein